MAMTVEQSDSSDSTSLTKIMAYAFVGQFDGDFVDGHTVVCAFQVQEHTDALSVMSGLFGQSTCVAQENPFLKPAWPLFSFAELVILCRMSFSKILRNNAVRATGRRLAMYFGSFPCFGIGEMTDVFHRLGVIPDIRHRLYSVVRHSMKTWCFGQDQ